MRYFVRGASCELSETIETKLELAKGTVGEFLGVAWKENTININNLPPGQIVDVEYPDFTILRINNHSSY